MSCRVSGERAIWVNLNSQFRGVGSVSWRIKDICLAQEAMYFPFPDLGGGFEVDRIKELRLHF